MMANIFEQHSASGAGNTRGRGDPSVHAASGFFLVVDPQEGERQRVADCLRDQGFAVSVAADPAAAADLLDAAPPRLYRLAVVEPSMSAAGAPVGTSASSDASSGLDRLLAHARRGLYLIVRSASRGGRAVVRCLDGGAADFIDKTAPAVELLRAVHAALSPLGADSAADPAAGGVRAERPLDGWIELTAASELDLLRRIQRFSDMLFARRLPPDLCEDLRTIIEEMGRNAIEWGNQFDAKKRIRISYCLLPDRIVLKFEDEGEGFQFQQAPDPTRDPIAHLRWREEQGKRPGGYGIYLAQQVMDEVVYSEKGNVVVLTKFIPRA